MKRAALLPSLLLRTSVLYYAARHRQALNVTKLAITVPAPNEWSANDVLAHLRACADMWGGCIVEIIAHDRPTLRAVNPTTWINKTDYREQAFQPSLHAFATQCTDLLAVHNEPLAPEGWSRAATVTGAGKPLVRTVHSYAEWLARHDGRTSRRSSASRARCT